MSDDAIPVTLTARWRRDGGSLDRWSLRLNGLDIGYVWHSNFQACWCWCRRDTWTDRGARNEADAKAALIAALNMEAPDVAA